MLEPNTRVPNAARRLAALSPRELDVARLVCCGDSAKLVAFKLGIATKTVEIHRANAIRKSGCGSLVELARLWEASLAEREEAAPGRALAHRAPVVLEVAHA